MSDKQVEIMAEWLAHLMEFGRKPTTIETVYHEWCTWPLHDDLIDFHLHRYTFAATDDAPAYTGIGMTGAITWSFIGDIGWDDFSYAELKQLYIGWYINFVVINGGNYDRTENAKLEEKKAREIRKRRHSFIRMVGFVSIGELTFFAYETKWDTVILTHAENNVAVDIATIYPPDDKFLRLPILYAHIGALFLAGHL